MPMRHWEGTKELAALEAVTSFPEMADIAIAILEKIGEPVSQVCGPISSGGLGSLQANMARFEQAINVMLGRGYAVFNQLPLQDAMIRLHDDWEIKHPGEYCWPILHDVYRPIFESGMVVRGCFIPGWQGSTGTEWEREKLTELNIEIFDIPPEWFIGEEAGGH